MRANNRLLNTVLWISLTVIVFYLLYIGQRLLIPFVIAVLLLFLIQTLAGVIRRPKISGFQIPRWLAFLLAIALIFTAGWMLISLIIDNVAQAVQKAPDYQMRIERVVREIGMRWQLERTPTLSEILGGATFTSLVRSFAAAVTSFISSLGIIVVYLIFLLAEYHLFARKLDRIFPNEHRRRTVQQLIENCSRDIKTFIGIKTLASLTTGVLCYFILKGANVDLAEFWALVIFLLNYIPTIGSIIGVLLPTLQTLVQFDSLRPFFVVMILLAAVQFTIGNLLEPRITGRQLNLSPIVILLCLGLWGSIWGIPGLFMAVPITVIMLIFFKYFPSTHWIAVLLSSNGDTGPLGHESISEAENDAAGPPESASEGKNAVG